MTCNHCGATVTSGLVLCPLCQQKVVDCLTEIPVHFRNLARWRLPNRPNGSLGSRGSWMLRRGDAAGPDQIGRATDQALQKLLTWAQLLVDARPYLERLLDRLEAARAAETVDDAKAVDWLCVGFRRHLSAIATLDWAGEFVRKLDDIDRTLRSLTETLVPGWYAGACRHCNAPTHVVPGMTWLTCQTCGASSRAADNLEIVLNEAADWVAPPMRLAEAIVALIDTEQSVPRLHKRISKWGESRTRKVTRDGYIVKVTVPPKLTSHRRRDADGDEVGPKRYRLGDVLDLLHSQGETRVRVSDERTTA